MPGAARIKMKQRTGHVRPPQTTESRLLQHRLRSLRFRLLVPIVMVSLAAAIGVAIGSSLLGQHWAMLDVQRRAVGLERALTQYSFPLNAHVLEALADLTQASLITLRGGELAASTLDKVALPDRQLLQQLGAAAFGEADNLVTLSDKQYVLRRVELGSERLDVDGISSVLILFDTAELRAFRWRAAGLPLLTGLSTVIVLTSVTLLLTSQLINRLSRLQKQVDQVAQGNFDLPTVDAGLDEVGLLSASLAEMSAQLKHLWTTVHRQQSEKLLHQIAGGLAHQLRNGLTGARMAVELHARHCPLQAEAERLDLQVALDQLDATQDYVQRLLLMAQGRQQPDQAATVRQCLDGIHSSLMLIAKHRQTEFSWHMSEGLAECSVADGPALAAAVNNLVLNALDAGNRVRVTFTTPTPHRMCIEVSDNGPGPPVELQDSLFDPFITSKPEGLGLGLPLVRRSAEKLGGEVNLSRCDGITIFRMTVPFDTKTD